MYKFKYDVLKLFERNILSLKVRWESVPIINRQTVLPTTYQYYIKYFIHYGSVQRFNYIATQTNTNVINIHNM